MTDPDPPPAPAPPRTATPTPPERDTYGPRAVLLALAFVLALVIGGLYLVHTLRNSSHLEDCLMQGRSNCSPVDTPPPDR